MLEQLKSIIVLLVVLFVAFGVGVLVGFKLPENETFKRWNRANQAIVEKAKPTAVAVMQMPGASTFYRGSDKSKLPLAGTHLDSCPGGVCKLPAPAQASDLPPVAAVLAEDKLNLTFYKELGDKPTESGGSLIKVKTTPLVARKKTPVSNLESAVSPSFSGTYWEIRICSLAQEIKARLVRSKLIKTYSEVEIEAVQVAGKGTWYRVKISNIKDRGMAERYQRELIEVHNYKPLIVKQ
jgi:hypothetical protein